MFNVLLYAFEMWTIKYRDKELLKAFKMKYYRRLFSGAGKLTYCAFFDKSTNFGTEVDQYIMNILGVEPPPNCPLAAVAAIFQNGRQLAAQEDISHGK